MKPTLFIKLTDHLGKSGSIEQDEEQGIDVNLDALEEALVPGSKTKLIIHATHEAYRNAVAALDESLEKLGRVGEIINIIRSKARHLGPAGIVIYNAGKGIAAGSTAYATTHNLDDKWRNATLAGLSATFVSASMIGLISAKIAQVRSKRNRHNHFN